MGKKFCNFYSPFPKSRCIIARDMTKVLSMLNSTIKDQIQSTNEDVVVTRNVTNNCSPTPLDESPSKQQIQEGNPSLSTNLETGGLLAGVIRPCYQYDNEDIHEPGNENNLRDLSSVKALNNKVQHQSQEQRERQRLELEEEVKRLREENAYLKAK